MKKSPKEQESKTPERIAADCKHGGEGHFACTACYSSALKLTRQNLTLQRRRTASENMLDLQSILDWLEDRAVTLEIEHEGIIERARHLRAVVERERRVLSPKPRVRASLA